MAFNGAGVYTLPAGTTAIAGAVITPALWNTFLADIQTAMNELILKNGAGAVLSANLDMTGHKVINMSPGTSSGHALRYEQVFPYLTTNSFQPPPAAIAGLDTSAWDNATSAIIDVDFTVPVTRFGTAGFGFKGPYYVRNGAATTGTIVHSATLICPGDVNLAVLPNDCFMLLPYSTVNGAVANSYLVIPLV